LPHVDVGSGVELYYEDFGSGRPLVFVHSGAATHDMWDHQVYHLTERYRTVVYDHRGVGGSSKPRDGYTVQQLADDLYALIHALELSDVTLVSHGLGGHVLLRCLATYPDAAARVCLVSAAPWYMGDKEGAGGFSESFFSGLNEGLARNNPQANWDLFEHYLFHKDPGEPMKHACLQMALAWPLYVWKELAKDLPLTDHREYLPRITTPALVAHGRHDRKNRYEGAEYLAEHLPNGKLVVFEHSAHSPFFEELEEFNEALSDFIEAAAG